MVIKDPKELIGKWFSNVAGIPDEYFYILDATKSTNVALPVFASYIRLKRRTIARGARFFRSASGFGSPLTRQRAPELRYQIHKCIKYIFEKEIKDELT